MGGGASGLQGMRGCLGRYDGYAAVANDEDAGWAARYSLLCGHMDTGAFFELTDSFWLQRRHRCCARPQRLRQHVEMLHGPPVCNALNAIRVRSHCRYSESYS